MFRQSPQVSKYLIRNLIRLHVIPLMRTLGKTGFSPETSGNLFEPVLALTLPNYITLLYYPPGLFRNAVSADTLPANLSYRPLHPRYLGKCPISYPVSWSFQLGVSSASKDHVDGGTVAERGSHTTLQWTQS